jgi:hypothetical protein
VAVVIDFSKYVNRVLEIDPERKRVCVEQLGKVISRAHAAFVDDTPRPGIC